MAYIGTLEELENRLAADPRFVSAFAYLKRCLHTGTPESQRVAALAADSVGEVPLENGTVAIEQVYRTRSRSNCFYESHRKYIDVQCVLVGEEIVDVRPIGQLHVDKPYRPEKDVIKYHDPGSGDPIRLGPGQAAVFFPEDGHMPGLLSLEPTLVRKTVVKVPCEAA